MPPRRKAATQAATPPHPDPLDSIDTNTAPSSSTATRRSSNKHPAPPPTRAQRATRTTRARVSEASTVDENGEDHHEEGSEDEDEEDSDEPVRPARRTTAAAASRRSAATKKPVSAASSTATASSTRSTGRATRRTPAGAKARVSEASTVASEAPQEEEEDDDAEEEEEEEPVKPRARASRTTAATKTASRPSSGRPPRSSPALKQLPSPSPTPTPADFESRDDDEEEHVRPARSAAATGRKKRVSLAPASPVKQPRLATPPEESETETEAEEEAEGKDDEDEEMADAAVKREEQDEQQDEQDEEDDEGTPQPVTPAKKAAAAKARAVVHHSDEDEDAEDEAMDEDVEAPPPAAQPAPSSPPSSPSAVKQPSSPSPSSSPAKPSPAAPVDPPKPPVPTALTASALASLARQSALEHAQQQAVRAKEMEGKPRLVIHQLVLENFKSYKGRGVIGPFHKSFSSIVGPNGSGKSNTIDALLFVFGFRAAKMRQGKFSELIHNSGAAAPSSPSDDGEEGEDAEMDEEDWDGGEDDEEESEEEDYAARKKGKGKGGKKAAAGAKGKGAKGKKRAAPADRAYAAGGCDFATVEVWFREVIDLPGGRDEFSVVPGSQLIVARTVRRDNSTRYTVNGKTTSPGEVKQLLLGRGIDLTHNRFLILQGEVESIAQMPPKGRTASEEGLLEYLEDIIGTADYKPLIETAVEEVERMGEERQVVLGRVKLVEREKGALEDRKKSADAYLRDQVHLVSFQSRLYQRHAHQAQADQGVYAEEHARAAKELEDEMERQREDRGRYEEGVGAVKETEKGLKEIEEAANALSKELATYEKAKVQLGVQKKAADGKYAKLKKALEEDKHARNAAEGAIRDHGDTLEKLLEGKETLKGELEEEQETLNGLMASLKDKVAPLNAQISENQRLLAPWQEQLEAKSNEIKIATQQLADVHGRAAHAQDEVARVEGEMEQLQELQAAKIGEMRELRRRQKEVRGEMEEVKGRVEEGRKREAKVKQAAQGAREKTLEAKASQSASQSKGAVLTAVQKLKDQGRLSGFHGRLGDLGRIDDAFDVAISTAAASGLESLVVDTRETAEAIFDHLRKHNIGRASCIALDRFPSNVDLAPIQTPRGTERLFDLVTPKDKIYAPVFRHVLKNTLVARDWDTAHAVSTGKVDGQRWRVVTTDGNIAEASGAAQVGGSRPVRGKMGSKIAQEEVSPKMLAKLEQEEIAAVGQLEEIQAEVKEVEGELKALVKEMQEIEGKIPKVEMDLEANKKDAEEKVALLEELQSQSEPDAADVKRAAQLEKSIASLEGDLEALRTKASKYLDAIAALEDQIRDVGGIKFRTAEAKVKDLQDQIRLTDTRVVKAKTEKAKAEKDAVKLAKAIETNTAKYEELEGEIEELQQQLAEKEAEAEPVRKTVEEAQARVEDGREQLANLKAELEEQEEAIIEFKKVEAELRGFFTDVDRKLKETTRILEHWAGKIGELQMPEFEILDDDESDHEAEEGVEPRQRAPKVEEVLRVLEPEEIEQIDVKRLKADIALLEERLEKNNADLAVLQEYKRRDEEFRKRGAEFEAISSEWDAAKNQVTELRNERLVKFMKGFGIISNKLKEMYQTITLGGNAELELYDSADPFSEGILFSVMPPKKSWKNISNLSGGEKTLSSLALVFALHVYKPTPLYFMDEIDAALDFRNVSIVASLIKERTASAQFIIISLRNNMFELSARLVGIYKVQNQTRSVCIDNEELSDIPSIEPEAADPAADAPEEEAMEEEES